MHSAQSQRYRHPGRAFVERYGSPRTRVDLLRYAGFLRHEAELDDQPPIDLSRVFRHFGMPVPRRVPLVDQQGLLFDNETGVILIKQDDPVVRQRFTKAHELMEFLFEAQEEVPSWAGPRCRFNGHRKEQLCEQGAAALLMPKTSFVPRLRGLGVSLETGSVLAGVYQTSLLATLFRMVRRPGTHALVIWRYALKPTQVRRLPAQEQMSLFGSAFVASPQKELRVWWATCTQGLTSGFIPKHKSIPRDSLIFHAYTTSLPQNGVEFVNLGRVQGHCLVEARHVTIGDECCVLSLLHLPGDGKCRKF